MKSNHAVIIGITGGIGSGKSAATNCFQQLGIDVVDADIVARQVVAVGSPILTEIAQAFGQKILQADGTLNRPLLRQIIFSDESKKSVLNSIMHPAIRTQILAELSSAQSTYVLLSAPLLFENGLDKLVSKVIVVDVDESLQITRASARDDIDSQQIQAIIASQIPRQARLAKADFVIDNSASLIVLNEQVQVAHRWALTVE